jgi:hypothetical protein
LRSPHRHRADQRVGGRVLRETPSMTSDDCARKPTTPQKSRANEGRATPSALMAVPCRSAGHAPSAR